MPIEILQHEQRVYYVALFGQRYSFVARSSILAEDLLISMSCELPGQVVWLTDETC